MTKTIKNLNCKNLYFGSGSMWIRTGIEMAPLDPDPYWEYGSGTVKMVSKKGKKSETSSSKEHSPFLKA